MDVEFTAFEGVFFPCGELEARYAGDTGEGFSPESQMMDGEKTVKVHQFACRMSLEAEQGIFSGHARSVIRDLDEGGAAPGDFYGDGACPGIEAVFHEFLDDGSGTFHDFSSGDLARQNIGHDVNVAHGLEMGKGYELPCGKSFFSYHEQESLASRLPVLFR